MFVHIHVSENVSCKIHKQVSCISRCLTLVWLFFFPPVGAVIRNVWLALKSAEVRIASHAGVFRGAREGISTSSPKNACVGG